MATRSRIRLCLVASPTRSWPAFLPGYGYKPHFVEGHEPESMHQLMATTLDIIIEEIHAIQNEARFKGSTTLPFWPMIILRSPKGWTGRNLWMASRSKVLGAPTRYL